MKFQIAFLIIFIPLIAFAQYPEGTPTIGLKAYYSFDNCDATNDTGNSTDGELFGMPDCDCGVSGSALEFDGVDDYVLFTSDTLFDANTIFDDDDFTISFYYKSYDNAPRISLLSKNTNCMDSLGLEIRQQSVSNIVLTEMGENAALYEELPTQLDPQHCWHHLVLTRDNRTIRVYIDGELASERTSDSRIDMDNSAPLSLSNSPCIGADGTSRFRGLIDELAIYDEALTALEIERMYLHPDEIDTGDTFIYQGNSLQPSLTPTCATSFSWSPTSGVSDPTIANPILSPDTTTTYALAMTDDRGCTTIDSLFIDVIDPNDLDCDKIFLPKAFTPNNGDNINNTYGISNPRAIIDFISFDIYSRWGGRVFSANAPSDQWDGTNNGSELNAGIYVYQLRYICKGEKRIKSGSITLIR